MRRGLRNKALLLAALCLPLAAQADRAWVTAQGGNALSVLDLETGAETARLAVPGDPAGVLVARDLGRVFTVSPGDHSLRAFSLEGALLEQTVLEGGPVGIARQGGLVFVSDWYNARIWVLEAKGLALRSTLTTGAAPAGLAVSPDGRWLVSADRDADALSVFALPDLTLHRRIPVGARPFAVSFDAEGRAYAANVGSDTVSVVAPETGDLLASLPTGKRPYGVAFAAGRIFVSNQYADTLSVFDADFTPLTTLEVGEYPEGIAAFDQGRKIAVANWFSDTLSVVDAEALTVLEEIPTAEGPRAFGPFIEEETP